MELRLLACWDCGFESRRGHGCLSLVSVVCCQMRVSASDRGGTGPLGLLNRGKKIRIFGVETSYQVINNAKECAVCDCEHVNALYSLQ